MDLAAEISGVERGGEERDGEGSEGGKALGEVEERAEVALS